LLPTVVALALLASCATTPPTRTTSAPTGTTAPQESTRTSPKSETQQRLINEANALATLASTEVGKRFLRATEALPAVSTRVAFRDDNTREFFSQAEADGLPAERRNKLSRISLDEYRYYYTKYGSPLAYLRALDVAAANGLDSVAGERILDFGYGSIGHLRLLASLGAHVVGIDPDSYLDALYGSVDQGAVPPARGVYRGAPGTIHLVHEKWPRTASAATRVASFGPYRLIVSKNTLKRGYIKPERRANKNQ
jgi:hypothetical protein